MVVRAEMMGAFTRAVVEMEMHLEILRQWNGSGWRCGCEGEAK